MARARHDDITRAELRVRRALTAERLWALLLAVAALLLTLSALVIAAAPSPQFCRACHGSEYVNLQKSPHKGVACDDCHTGATVYGLTQSRLRTLDMVVRQFSFGPKHLVATIDSKRCAVCHTKDIAETSDRTGLRMSHRAPIEKGWACTTCHVAVAHPREKDARVGYTMDTCMRCHSSNAKDPSGCVTCHAGKAGGEKARAAANTPWRVTHGPNWQRTHGMGDLKTCKSCHADDYCVRCHNLNVPHPDSYITLHGRDVLGRTTGSRDCKTCHLESSCDNCHGIPMPHAPDFLREHKAEVTRLGEKACLRCHDKKSCDGCHTRHIHPGLSPEWLKWLKARPTQ